MQNLMARLKQLSQPQDDGPPASLESRLLRAMAAWNEQAFDGLVQEWEEIQPFKPLMNWGIYHLDAWGVDRALGLGVTFQKEHLEAYFNQLVVDSITQFADVQEQDVLRAWPAIWERLKDEPGFADNALLKVCLLWDQGNTRTQPLRIDWGSPAFAGLMAHVPQDGLLSWESPRVTLPITYRVSPLQLAWIGADASLCQALLARGADPNRVCSKGSWPYWTFAKATQDLEGLLRESEFRSPSMARSAQDQFVKDMNGLAKSRRQALPNHSEWALASLSRLVPLDKALPVARPSAPKPRF